MSKPRLASLRTDLAMYLVRDAVEPVRVEARESLRYQLVPHLFRQLVQQNLNIQCKS